MEENEEIIWYELADADNGDEYFDTINRYLNSSDDKSVTAREVKKVMGSTKFKNLPFDKKRKLLGLYDPSQKISSSVLEKELKLYQDIINDKQAQKNPENYSEFIQFVDSIYDDEKLDIRDYSTDRLFALIDSLKPKKSAKFKKTTAMKAFEAKIPALYEAPVDSMTNKRLKVLINYVCDQEYSSLPQVMKEFVRRLFNRCAVACETSDNNKKYFSTSEWFSNGKFVPSNYYSQLNKAFFDMDLYKDSLWFNNPAKNLSYSAMRRYANVQYVFIYNVKKYAQDYNRSIADIINSLPDYVYKLARNVAIAECVPSFPDYDSSNPNTNFYVPDTREYKDKILPKMANLFASMLKDGLQDSAGAKDCEIMVKKLAPNYVSTKKMSQELNAIWLKHHDNDNFEEVFMDIGKWAVNLVHLDKYLEESVESIVRKMYPFGMDEKTKKVEPVVQTKKPEIEVPVDNGVEPKKPKVLGDESEPVKPVQDSQKISTDKVTQPIQEVQQNPATTSASPAIQEQQNDPLRGIPQWARRGKKKTDDDGLVQLSIFDLD